MMDDIASNENYSQAIRMEENRKAHDVVVKELARQVSVHCMDQGLLLERCLQFYTDTVNDLPKLFIAPLEATISSRNSTIGDLEVKVEDWKKKHEKMEKRYKDAREEEGRERVARIAAERAAVGLKQTVADLEESLATKSAHFESMVEKFRAEQFACRELEDKVREGKDSLEKMTEAKKKSDKEGERLAFVLKQTEGLLEESLIARKAAIDMLDAEKLSRRNAEIRADTAEDALPPLERDIERLNDEVSTHVKETMNLRNECATLRRDLDDMTKRNGHASKLADSRGEELRIVGIELKSTQDNLTKELHSSMTMRAENQMLATETSQQTQKNQRANPGYRTTGKGPCNHNNPAGESDVGPSNRGSDH